MRKPRIYNRQEQQEIVRRRKLPGAKIALNIIDDSLAPWRKTLARDIATGNRDSQWIAQTVIKVLEKTKEDIIERTSSK
jgi:hypothetical protein